MKIVLSKRDRLGKTKGLLLATWLKTPQSILAEEFKGVPSYAIFDVGNILSGSHTNEGLDPLNPAQIEDECIRKRERRREIRVLSWNINGLQKSEKLQSLRKAASSA